MTLSIFDLLPVSARVDDQERLMLGDMAVSDLARQFGTPLYIYDAATVQAMQRELTAALSAYAGKAQVTYAAKAYFSLPFGRKLVDLGIGVDVVSLGEMTVARKAGFDPDSVHLHGNNKSEEEIRMALEWGIHCIVADSLDDLALIEQVAQSVGKPARVWLRITPGVEIDVHPYVQTAKLTSKFGFGLQDGQAVEGIRHAKASRWLELTGLHIHLGSQIHQAAPFAEAITMMVELAGQEGVPLSEISPGGGWGVPYTDLETPHPVSEWVGVVCTAVEKEFTRMGWPLPTVFLEPGRWLVARAGLSVYRVGTSKRSADGRKFISVDGGMADNPRPPLYHARYMAVMPDNMRADCCERVAVVGKFCESGDELISDITLPFLKRGDLLALPVSGAYHLSMASNYNLAPRPAVLWVEAGRVEVLQKREQPEESGWFLGD